MLFTVEIFKEKDGTYAATCLHVPGRVGRGRTRKAAIESIKKILLGHIDRVTYERPNSARIL